MSYIPGKGKAMLVWESGCSLGGMQAVRPVWPGVDLRSGQAFYPSAGRIRSGQLSGSAAAGAALSCCPLPPAPIHALSFLRAECFFQQSAPVWEAGEHQLADRGRDADYPLCLACFFFFPCLSVSLSPSLPLGGAFDGSLFPFPDLAWLASSSPTLHVN